MIACIHDGRIAEVFMKRLHVLVLIVALFTSVLSPVMTVETAYAVTIPHLGSVYRVKIDIANEYVRNRLIANELRVVTHASGTYTVADMQQVGWLARTGYQPRDVVDVLAVGARNAPTIVMPRMSPRDQVVWIGENPSSRRSWIRSLDERTITQFVERSGVDTDNDGLTDDEEAIWCLNATRADTNANGVTDSVEVSRARDWLANRRERSSGLGIPYLKTALNVGDCIDTDEDGVPNLLELLLGLNPNRMSSDLDEYDDAQEVFGRTVVANETMPSVVTNPGRHPFVAAFPKPVITIKEDSIRVNLVTTVKIGNSSVTTTSMNYTSTSSTSVETINTTVEEWNDWLSVQTRGSSTGRRARTLSEGDTDTWTVYTQDTESADGGAGTEFNQDWDALIACINRGIYDDGADCTEYFYTYPDGEDANTADPCIYDASGCGFETAWDGYGTDQDVYANDDTSLDDLGIGDVACDYGYDGGCLPGEVVVVENDVPENTVESDDRGNEQSGDTIIDNNTNNTIIVENVEPIESAPDEAPTLENNEDVATDDVDTSVEVITFEEQQIDNNGQIIPVTNYDNVTAMNTAHAADLWFTYNIRNDGTDTVSGLRDVKFNVYLNDEPYPMTTYALSQSFGDILPNTTSSDFTIPSNQKIPLTLAQLKAIEMDPVCAEGVRTGVLPSTTQCPGGRIRITVADMIYDDQASQNNAEAGGVMVGIDDGNLDEVGKIDWFVLPTWELATTDTIADVIQRYFPMSRNSTGDLVGVRTPKFGTSTPPRGCNNSSLVGTGVNAVLWCPFELSRTQWMEILTDGVVVSQDIALAPASAGAKVILRLERDSDDDGYSDDIELEYGTNPSDATKRPVTNIGARVSVQQTGGQSKGTLILTNRGTFPVHGVKATMFAPTRDVQITNNQIGGSGFVDAGTEVIIGSDAQINTTASTWTGSAVIDVTGIYSGTTNIQYTLTASCSDTCEVGSGDTTLAWSSSDGDAGTLNIGAGYDAPNPQSMSDYGLQIGIHSGAVVNGDRAVINGIAALDTFTWQSTDGTTAPAVVIEYGDAEGAHRLMVPDASLVCTTGPQACAVNSDMTYAPTTELYSYDYTADQGGKFAVVVHNTLTRAIIDSQILVRIVDGSGNIQWQHIASLAEVPVGPTVVKDIAWATADFIDGYDTTKSYYAVLYWGDYQGNTIDQQLRPLSDVQNDVLPRLGMTLEGNTPVTVPYGQTEYVINIGTVAQGMPLKRMLTFANVGDVPMRASINKVANTQTSFTGAFFVPAGLVLPYIIAFDTGALTPGAFNQTVSVRTSDPTWPVLNIRFQGTIVASPVGASIAYVEDVYEPLTTGVYVKGPQSRRAVVKYNEAAVANPGLVHPLAIYDDLSGQAIGVGRKIVNNPSVFGFDSTLANRSGGVVVERSDEVAPVATMTPTPFLSATSTATPTPVFTVTPIASSTPARAVSTSTPELTMTPVAQVMSTGQSVPAVDVEVTKTPSVEAMVSSQVGRSLSLPDINNGCYWREADGTRHRYELLSGTFNTISSAKSAASSKSMNSVMGYLLTTTTSAEMECISQLVSASLPNRSAIWLSGSDSLSEGNWLWDSGPDSGMPISPGFWQRGEPNDTGGIEDCILAYINWVELTPTSSWNDAPCTVPNIYVVVEYSAQGTALDGGSNSATATRTLTPSRTPTHTNAGSGDTSIVIQDNDWLQSLMPPASELKDVVQICAGDQDIMVLKRDGTIRKWGRQNAGIPTWVTQPGANIKQIACGGNGGLAINGNGQIVNLGYVGTIPSLSNVKQIVAGGNNVFASDGHAAALLSDGTVHVWGNILNLGLIKPAPNDLSGISKIAQQDASRHFLALKNDKTVIAWGANWAGQANVPANLTDVVDIGSGAEHSMALKSDGTLVMWGNNNYGQLNPPAGLSNIVEITGGWFHSLARLADGRVVSWGELSTVPSVLTGKRVVGMAGSEHWSVFVVQDGTSATPTRTLTPSRTPTPSRTLTPSRTATATATRTPTPNNGFSVDKADTGPERERRILIPTAFSQSARYRVENGLQYTFTTANSIQSAQVRLPVGEYSSFTLEVWALDNVNGLIDVDIGANGSVDWRPRVNGVGRITSIQLANALNTYMSRQTGEAVNVPITIKSPRAGTLMVARVKGVPKPMADLNVDTMQLSRSVVCTERGMTVHQLNRSSMQQISTIIRNSGKSASSVTTVVLAVDIPGQGLWYIDSKVVRRLTAGANQVVTFSWDASKWPTMRGQLKLIVDPYNSQGDRVLGNNVRALNISIVEGVVQPTATPTRTATRTATRTVTRTPTKPRPTLTRTPTRRR